MRRPVRVLSVTLLFLLVLIAGFVGCGRSSIEGYDLLDAATDGPLVDGGPDALDTGLDGGGDDADGGGCNAKRCPTGCCDGRGVCRTGADLNDCGSGGNSCSDCVEKGFDFCDPKAHACARQNPTCTLQNCADGCCNGTTCFDGTSSVACGSGAQACKTCNVTTEACDTGTHACVQKAKCGPGNCGGCCGADGQCHNGTDNAACGENGQACAPCPNGTKCDSGGALVGGTCQGPAKCNAGNCKNGCCFGDQCVPGTSDTACGIGGNACANCTAQGNLVCQGQGCVANPTCNGTNCPGCCDSQDVCHGGFLNTRCGSGGASCSDCTAQATTCNISIDPRVCNNQQTTCPAPYGSCPGGVSTPVPVVQTVCPAADLADARAACGAGPDSVSCNAFFSFEKTTNPTCASCLAPFDAPFAEGSGLFACVAPFVAPDCNHDTGCVVDCRTQSCAQCPAGATTQCENSVSSQNGQCRTYIDQSSCTFAAFGASGAFCNPANYGGNFGRWLQGVGGHYCLQ